VNRLQQPSLRRNGRNHTSCVGKQVGDRKGGLGRVVSPAELTPKCCNVMVLRGGLRKRMVWVWERAGQGNDTVMRGEGEGGCVACLPFSRVVL